jgi:hypothetical protein
MSSLREYTAKVNQVKTQEKFLFGDAFPHEGFVQRAIELHFESLGFKAESHGHADLYSIHQQTGETWLVKAKCLTKDVGFDFRTGLGQLLQQMDKEQVKYGLAVPRVPQFLRQCRLVSLRVTRLLSLQWLLVEADGTVDFVDPGELPDKKCCQGDSKVADTCGDG